MGVRVEFPHHSFSHGSYEICESLAWRRRHLPRLFFFFSILFSWSDGRGKLCVVKKRKRLVEMYLFLNTIIQLQEQINLGMKFPPGRMEICVVTAVTK